MVLTTACNQNCSYCYQNARGNSSMDWETLRAALDLLLQSEEDEVSLTFYGGEPLLEFPRIIRAIRYVESAASPRKNFEFHLITNGTLLDLDAANFLARHGVETQISFDGIRAAQDRRAQGTFDRLDHLLVELREKEESFFNQNCSVAITLSSRNVHYLAQSFAHFLDRGVHEVAVAPLVTHDPDWRPDLIDVLVEQVALVLQMSQHHRQKTGETPFVPFQTKTRREPAAGDGPPAMCAAADTNELALDVDGQLFRCVMMVDSYQNFQEAVFRDKLGRLRLGNLDDPDLDRRLADYPAAVKSAGIFSNKKDKYSSYRKCGECRFLQECSICPVSICHIPGNTDPNRVPDLACAVNLVLLAARQHYLQPSSAPADAPN